MATLDPTGYMSAQDPRTLPGYTPPPNGAIRDVQLGGGSPASLSDLSSRTAQNLASSVPSGGQGDQFASIINLLKQYQQGGQTTLNQAQDQQIGRGIATDPGLIGASPGEQNASRDASMNALNPTIGGARDVINSATSAIKDYQAAQASVATHAENVMKTILESTDLSSIKNLDPKYLNQLEADAGYPKGFIQAATTYKEKQAQLAAAKLAGNGSRPDDATVLGWVTAIKAGQAKLTDISNKNLRDAVVKGLTAQGTPQSDMLKTTKDSLQKLNDMVTNNNGFSAAVGVKGFSQLFGLKAQPFAGSSAADFDAKLKQTVNDVVLPNLTILHGLGRVTDREFQALQSSITSLSTNLSESEFKKELKDITDRVNKIESTPSGPNAGDTKVYNGATYKVINGNWVKQ